MAAGFKQTRREAGTPEPPSPEGGRPADGASLSIGLASTLAARHEELLEKGRRDRRRWLWIGALAVAVAALSILAALSYYDVGKVDRATSSNDPTSYYGALGAALATARASFWSWPASGPGLVFAEGLDSPTPLGPAVNTTHLGAVSCAPTLISTPSGSLPAFRGALTSGRAPEWLYAFLATGNTLVVVAVVNGTSAVVATTPTNGACYNGPSALNTVPIDSAIAGGTAGATSTSSKFLTKASGNSTGVSAEFYLVPPGYLMGPPGGDPMWIVTDTTCALYGSSSVSGSTLTSVVDASTDSLVSQKATAVTC